MSVGGVSEVLQGAGLLWGKWWVSWMSIVEIMGLTFGVPAGQAVLAWATRA